MALAVALVPVAAVAAVAPAAEAPEPAEEPPPPIYSEARAPGFSFRHDNGVTGRYLLPEITCGGAALLDHDGDGDLDLFLVQGGPLAVDEEDDAAGDDSPAPSDRLFRNDLHRGPDGRPVLAFTDVTAEAGVTDSAYGCGAAVGDYDGDGHVDLYVTNLGPNRLLRNRGDGTFEDATEAAGADDPRWSTSAAFTDYDADGHLDLFVVNYVVFDAENQKACRTAAGAPDYCNPAAYAGVSNRLLHNRGDGTFEDVSGSSGVGEPRGKSLGTVTADLDGDGRTDLYVTNDGEPNELWLQRRPGRFEDAALFAGAAVSGRGRPEASMGVVVADDDRDGDLDLFLTHLTGETHTLYRNDGAGGFRDATVAAGLAAPTVPATGWGVAWTDYDNDGWLDLPVVNGAVRTLPALADAGDPYPFHQVDQLFRNRGGEGQPGRYADASDAAGDLTAPSAVSRGLAAGDVDDDGDTDLLVVDAGGAARLLLARRGQDQPWLGLRLVGGAGGRDMLGARAELLDPDGRVLLLRRAASDGGYAAAHDPRVLFGLGGGEGAATEEGAGAAEEPAAGRTESEEGETGAAAAAQGPPEAASPRRHTVRVTWPDGRRELYTGLPEGRYTTLRQGEGEEIR